MFSMLAPMMFLADTSTTTGATDGARAASLLGDRCLLVSFVLRNL